MEFKHPITYADLCKDLFTLSNKEYYKELYRRYNNFILQATTEDKLALVEFVNVFIETRVQLTEQDYNYGFESGPNLIEYANAGAAKRFINFFCDYDENTWTSSLPISLPNAFINALEHIADYHAYGLDLLEQR